jgi:hypothetical protein
MLTDNKLIVKIPSFPIRILLNRSGPISCPGLKNSPSIIQYMNLIDVDRIMIGFGTQGNITIPGGSGKMFFDDLRPYRPKEISE